MKYGRQIDNSKWARPILEQMEKDGTLEEQGKKRLEELRKKDPKLSSNFGHNNSVKTIKNVLRWIAVLPTSLFGMALSFGLWNILHTLTAARYIDVNSWFNIFFAEIMSNFIAGAAFVFIGYKVAPSNQKTTAIILTILLLLLAGSSFFIVNFMTKDYFSNTGIIAGVVGSVVCCVGIIGDGFGKNNT